MSETKHTPWPWFQSHREKPNGMFSTEVYDKEGQVICVLAWHAVSYEGGVYTDREANARLIAAAPDLLEALKAALGHCDCSDATGRGLIPCSEANPCAGCYTARMGAAAIAKAEGRDV